MIFALKNKKPNLESRSMVYGICGYVVSVFGWVGLGWVGFT